MISFLLLVALLLFLLLLVLLSFIIYSKYFSSSFWLNSLVWLIIYNQIALTKFGRRLRDLIKWRQYFNARTRTDNPWGRGCVVLMTWSCRKWRKISHVLRRKNSWTYLKTCKNGKNTTGRISGISALETKHPKFAEKQVWRRELNIDRVKNFPACF